MKLLLKNPFLIILVSLALFAPFAHAGDTAPVRTVADAPSLVTGDYCKQIRLAAELFNDGLYDEARTEAGRVMLENAGKTNSAEYADARLVRALSSYVSGTGGEIADICNDETAPMSARITAAYVIGTLAVADSAEAAQVKRDALTFVFTGTDDTSMFWNAGCLLYFMMKEDSEAREKAPLVWKQLETVSSVWPVEIVRACKASLADSGEKKAPWPILAGIAFYRSQISPAIGKRCLLEPSCSEFYLQACRKHGWLGMGIGGDRFFREPSITGDERLEIVMPDDTIRYSDPVSAHDFWLK